MTLKGTTICAVLKDGKIAVAGDGQVTMGESTIFKATAHKVRRIYGGKVVTGFAGTVSDAFALSERFEAKLVDAPFVKVEATKFTEVGYVGRDVESIIRDLVEASVRICKEQASQKVKARATVLAEDRIVDLILHPNRKPANPIDVLLGNKPKEPAVPEGERQQIARRAQELRGQLMRGEL